MIKRWSVVSVFLIVLGLGFGGCATDGEKTAQPPANAILVGVTANYPPVIFKMSGQITGLEADLARRLSAELGKPIQFVEISWDGQIPALLEGKTDIIMSGMTITQARQVRITFSQPYLKSGLMIAFGTQNALKYNSLGNIIGSVPAVGFVEGTTGEVYARDVFRMGNRMVPVKSASEAALALKNRRFDIFVYDAPSIIWIVSENEAELKFLPEFLNTEYLGWGLRRDDRELLVKVNALLNKWEKDGTLKETILKWLPYWKQF
jgi:ABC-type amino acid transport substrate-binding protein